MTKIIPGSVKPFDEVKDASEEADRDAARRQRRPGRCTIRSRTRASSGKSLAEAAKSVGLETAPSPPSTRRATIPTARGRPARARRSVSAVFASDVGVDDAALNTHDRGYLWFDVAKVDPPHDAHVR